MTLERAYFVAEITAATAVILSLIYVGIQIKQNTDTLKLRTAYDATEEFSDIYLVLTENSDLADIWFRGLQGLDALEGVERLRFYAYFQSK